MSEAIQAAPQASECSWQAVLATYERAQQVGATRKLDTQVHLLADAKLGVEYVVRVATVLKEKPKGDNSGQQSQARRDPFLPYEEDLWVQHLSESHTLLLNKFNVVPYHLLVVTRQFESQQDPLNARDFAATWKVLQAMPQGGLAFYNCGEHSGRSQPHKHVQVVPLPFTEGQAPVPPVPPVQPLVDAATAGAAPLEPLPLNSAPFTAFVCRLTPGVSPEELEGAAAQLHASCQEAAPWLQPLSYNVVLTLQFLMIVPRSQEQCGPCASNSLGFAGTILVRSEEELDFVRETGPSHMLTEVGVAWGQQPPSPSPTL